MVYYKVIDECHKRIWKSDYIIVVRTKMEEYKSASYEGKILKGDRCYMTKQADVISRQMNECYRTVFGEDVVEVILYGSYARGDYTADSDIDIVAIVKGDRLTLQKKLKVVWDMSAEIGLENDVVVSPMVIPHDEFLKYRKVLPYYRNIWKEGKKIG